MERLATDFKRPILIPAKMNRGLGTHFPKNLSVDKVAEIIGRDFTVPCIRVGTQTTKTITLGEFTRGADAREAILRTVTLLPRPVPGVTDLSLSLWSPLTAVPLG